MFSKFPGPVNYFENFVYAIGMHELFDGHVKR